MANATKPGNVLIDPLVVGAIVRIDVPLVLLGVTEAGEKVPVNPDGRPATDNRTGFGKLPPTG